MSETSHYLSTGHSFIYVLSVRDVTLSKCQRHRSLIYIRPNYLNTGHSFIYVRDIALSKHRSLIYIRPKCQRCRIIYAQVTHLYTS